MPTVSIIIPCYNEEATIYDTLQAVHAQTYPRAQMEVVIADALSKDRTRERIAEFQQAHPDLPVRVVDNARRIIPAALNRAIEAAQGEIIVRMDAHSKPYPDYVERCVRALEEGRGDNVGGVWEIRAGAPGWMAEGIAVAAAHPLGAGDAAYRLDPEAGPEDTVPFGAFRKSLVERIGKFDESLLTNEDYEFNARIRKAGGVVWLDPQIRSVYYARPTFVHLARQYWRYGFWKWRMLRRYPGSLRWRQALPPIFVASLLLIGGLATYRSVPRHWLATELFIYGLILGLAGLFRAARLKKFHYIVSMPLALAMMHFAWGGGFLWSMISIFPREKKRNG
jgi:glycosyltransferase involved in cell wall biosynthesis